MLERMRKALGRGGGRDGSSEAVLPTDTRPAMVFGLAVLLLTFGGFGTWAAVSRIESAVIAPGSLKVTSNRKEVQHLEGGIVKELLVENGDRVQEGAVLVRLDETRARASLQILRGQYASARASVARLQAELVGDDAVAYSPELKAEVAADPVLAELLDGQDTLFTARRLALEGQISMIAERIGQLKEEIEGRRAQEASRADQIALLEDELAGLQELYEKGHAPRTRLLALQREKARLEGERGEHLAAIARSKRLISEARLEMLQVRHQFAQEVAEELRQRQDEMFDLAERVSAAEFTADKIEITAPVSGFVVGLAVHTEGGVVQPGETLMEIVPEDDTLIVETRVRPVDIDEVALGQDAAVVFTGLPQRSTPRLAGAVSYVSADVMIDEATQMPFYTVRVEVPEHEAARLGNRLLQPGMPAEVMIKTGARTPLNYLAQPIADSLRRAWKES